MEKPPGNPLKNLAPHGALAADKRKMAHQADQKAAIAQSDIHHPRPGKDRQEQSLNVVRGQPAEIRV